MAVNEKRCIGFALVLVPWPRQADSAENPMVKTKLRGLAQNKSQESTRNIHIIHYVMTSFTLDPLHSEIFWLRGPFFELLRFFCDGADLFALQRQSSCTLTRSREATL